MANAHFVFVVPNRWRDRASILSEELKPTHEVDVGLIGGTKLSLRDVEGHETPLALTKRERGFVAALPTGIRVIHGIADLGFTQRGPEKPNVLIYYPKQFWAMRLIRKLSLERKRRWRLFRWARQRVAFRVAWAWEAPTQAEMTILLPDGTGKKATTDEEGQTEELTQTGRYGAWARFWEPLGGEREGKAYVETRHYATLVFDIPATAVAAHFATLPQPASSLGAVVSDGWLYVYGGHIAPTHVYSTEAVSGQFARLNLSGNTGWQPLPGGPGLQGMNLAAHKGLIYRIGGMAPRNKPGDAVDNYSVADCARFDPATMKWEPLPPLPEPRSSHDVVVMGDKLIVVGGWALKGGARTEWRDSLAVLDFAAGRLEWKTVKQPFTRRALIAAPFSGKMYVMGGFDENSRVARAVSIYDPAGKYVDHWSGFTRR